MRRRAPLLLAAALASLPLSGCDLTRFTANSSASLFVQASAGLERHWDPVLVGDALPASIIQLEGVFRVVPDNEPLGIAMMRAYCSYGLGWVEDRAQEAHYSTDFDALDEEARHMAQARLLYERARNVGLHLMRLRDPAIDDVDMASGAALQAYLATRYPNPQDAALLFWTGFAWGSMINAGRDDPELIVQLGTARTFVEHAVSLDEGFYNYSGLTFLGALKASVPNAPPEELAAARALFERALEGTDREFFTIHVTYARTYAIQAQDRNLFIRLLREVLEGGDPSPENRLSNRLARRQALRLLRNIDGEFNRPGL